MNRTKNRDPSLVTASPWVVLIGIVGCASSMVAPATRHADGGATPMIEASTDANDKVEARQAESWSRESVSYVTGRVDTGEVRREAGRVAWRTEGLSGALDELTVGARTVGSWGDDVMIRSKVEPKLLTTSLIKAGDVIAVSPSQGVVTRHGRSGSETIKSAAERTARATKSVTGANNELLVGKLSRSKRGGIGEL